MTTRKRFQDLLRPAGFTHDPTERAFHTFRRTHPTDGRQQILRFVVWHNDRVADEQGQARRHLVIIPAADAAQRQEDTRLMLPLVKWPSQDQPVRPWQDVAQDLRGRVLPVLDMPEEQGRERLAALDELMRQHGYI